MRFVFAWFEWCPLMSNCHQPSLFSRVYSISIKIHINGNFYDMEAFVSDPTAMALTKRIFCHSNDGWMVFSLCVCVSVLPANDGQRKMVSLARAFVTSILIRHSVCKHQNMEMDFYIHFGWLCPARVPTQTAMASCDFCCPVAVGCAVWPGFTCAIFCTFLLRPFFFQFRAAAKIE